MHTSKAGRARMGLLGSVCHCVCTCLYRAGVTSARFLTNDIPLLFSYK